MNIRYQRNLKNSYMVVIEPGQPLNMDGQLAEKMMERQQIPGLLKWVTMEHEGDMTFWYQITGLQSLADWLRHHPLNFRLFGHLLGGLMALQEELPRFYLKCEHLILQAEQIFLDPSGEQAVFCYEPLWQKEPRESLRELMEQLLPLINHEDKDAVRLGYGLYEKCQEPNADIWQYVLEQSGNGNLTGEIRSVPEKEMYAADEPKQCAKEPAVSTQEYAPVPEAAAQSQLFGRLRPKVSDALPRRMFEKLPVVSARAWFESLRKAKKEEPAETTYLFEPEEKPQECAHPTVFLGEAGHAEGRLLYQGAGGEESFLIEGDSFLVGGRNDQADGRLHAAGVSRNHARITREEQTYYIEDLNSRNGTYINGKLLPYKQKCQVKPGDRLRFAREEYVFY